MAGISHRAGTDMNPNSDYPDGIQTWANGYGVDLIYRGKCVASFLSLAGALNYARKEFGLFQPSKKQDEKGLES